MAFQGCVVVKVAYGDGRMMDRSMTVGDEVSLREYLQEWVLARVIEAAEQGKPLEVTIATGVAWFTD